MANGGAERRKEGVFERLNRNPIAIGAVSEVGLKTGQLAGLARGAWHTGEDLWNTASYVTRALNPALDHALSPGRSVSDEALDVARSAADYAVRAWKDPHVVKADLNRFRLKLRTDLDPTATPPAKTAAGEFRRTSNIGANQGELAADVAAGLAGAEVAQGVGAAVRGARATRYLSKAGWNGAEKYLAKPYEGMGHHSIFPRSWTAYDWLGGWKMPDVILESPFNKVTFRHETQGGAYAKHVAIDDHAYSFRMPARLGVKSWSGKEAGIERLKELEKLWAGTPEAIKTTAGGIAGGAYGVIEEPQGEERLW